jgi:hypothetical protein
MKKIICLFVCLFAGTANAVVINFDAITTTDEQAISANYAGMSWGGNWYVESSTSSGNGSVSGDYAAFNGFGELAMNLSSDVDFDFTGAYFTSWTLRGLSQYYSATSITIEGYNNNALIGSVSMNLSADQYDWFQADLLGVDEVRFISSSSKQWWLMDDLTINESTSVPEPASVALFGLGLAGLIFSRRKKIACLVPTVHRGNPYLTLVRHPRVKAACKGVSTLFPECNGWLGGIKNCYVDETYKR